MAKLKTIKAVKFSALQIVLLIGAIEDKERETQNAVFPPNSFVTKDYILRELADAKAKLIEADPNR